MVWRWVLMVCVTMVLNSWLLAQPKVTVQGTLKGYFLSPDGTLAVYEVPFTFPNKPANEKLPIKLFPLWAHYYLRMRVEVSGVKPHRLQLRVGRKGKVVTLEEIAKSSMIAIPELPNDWVQVHAKMGLNLELALEFENGAKVAIHPQYAVQLGPVQTLKIDWRDLTRIAKIRQFLQERGDELIPGLRADNIPFLLEGEEGQWVLVGKGFSEWWRYRGMAPYGLDIFLLPFRFIVPPKIKERALAGVAKTRLLGIVVILFYQDGWDALEEVEKPKQSVRHAERTFAIIHEIVHYWLVQKFGWTEEPEPLPYADLDGYLAWMMEGNALSQAFEATQPEQRVEAIKDFLLFRWYRRQIGCGNPKSEQQGEWDEGVATFLAEKALEIGREQLEIPLDYVPSLFFLELEPFGQPILNLALPFDPTTKARDWGYVQVKLLDKVMPDWSHSLGNQQSSLDELLAKAVGFDSVNMMTLSEDQVRKEIRVHAKQRGWIKPLSPKMKEGYEIVVLAPLSPLEDISNSFDFEWSLFSSCEVTLKGCQVKSERDVMVSQIQSKGGKVLIFRWILPASIVLRLKRDGKNGRVTLEGQGIRVEVEKSEVWRMPQSIVVGSKDWAKAWALAHAEKPEEVIPMKLSAAWTIITLAAVATFGTGVTQAQSVQVTGVVSGRFLNTWTNTVEYHFIEFVPDPNLSEYSSLEPLDDEEYEVTIQAFDPEGRLLRLSLLLTDGQEVSVVSEKPTDQLTLTHKDNWYKIFRPIAELVEWFGRVAVKVLKTIGEELMERELRKLLQGKKKGTLAVHVRIVDLEQNSISPFSDVKLEVWLGNKRVLPFPNDPNVIRPDGNGDWSRLLPEAPNYLVRAVKTLPLVACNEAWDGPIKVEKNQTSRAQLRFLYHKSIIGQVVEQTSSGSLVPLPYAIASLWKGDVKVSEDQLSGTDGRFTIPARHIDTALNQYGSGTYYLKVIPPSRSMLRAKPPSYPTEDRPTNVTLTKCERTKPSDTCPRALTINAGIFIFTYEPAFRGPGG